MRLPYLAHWVVTFLTIASCRQGLELAPKVDADRGPAVHDWTVQRIVSDFTVKNTAQAQPCVFEGSVDEVWLPAFADKIAERPIAVLNYGHIGELSLAGTKQDRLQARIVWPVDTTVYFAANSLPLSLMVPVDVAGSRVRLRRGARVTAWRSDQQGGAHIYRGFLSGQDTSFEPKEYTSMLPCSALGLPHLDLYLSAAAKLEPNDAVVAGAGNNAELVSATALRESPNGKIIATVGGKGWAISILQQRDGWIEVADRAGAGWEGQGFDFVGWIEATRLRRGGLPVALAFGKAPIPPTHRSRGRIPIRTRPATSGQIVAHIAEGVPVLISAKDSDFSAVELPGFLPAERGAVFWIDAQAVASLEHLQTPAKWGKADER
jgi:hypothetical protein